MLNQMTVFDFLIGEDIPKAEVLCGAKYDVELGRELSFKELKGFIGKKVVIQMYGEQVVSVERFKVVTILDYKRENDGVYKQMRPLPEKWRSVYGEFVNEHIHDMLGAKDAMSCYELYDKRYDRVYYTDKEGESHPNSNWSDLYQTGPLSDANSFKFFELKC